MPHIISTVRPGASGAARNELSLLELDNVHGGFASSEHGSGGNAFLKIGGISGESNDDHHKD
jgi:hypothetical protein